jgi:hypothetical protein
MGTCMTRVRTAGALLVAFTIAACDTTVTPHSQAVPPARSIAAESADFATTFDVSEYLTDVAFAGRAGCDDAVMSGSTVRHVAGAMPDSSVFEIWVRRARSGVLQHVEGSIRHGDCQHRQ